MRLGNDYRAAGAIPNTKGKLTVIESSAVLVLIFQGAFLILLSNFRVGVARMTCDDMGLGWPLCIIIIITVYCLRVIPPLGPVGVYILVE